MRKPQQERHDLRNHGNVAGIIGGDGHGRQGTHQVVEPGQEGEADILTASEALLPRAEIGFRNLVVVTALHDEHGLGKGGRRGHGAVARAQSRVLRVQGGQQFLRFGLAHAAGSPFVRPT